MKKIYLSGLVIFILIFSIFFYSRVLTYLLHKLTMPIKKNMFQMKF